MSNFPLSYFHHSFALANGSCPCACKYVIISASWKTNPSFNCNSHCNPSISSLFPCFTLHQHFSKLSILIFYNSFPSYLSQAHSTQTFTLPQNYSYKIPVSFMLLNPMPVGFTKPLLSLPFWSLLISLTFIIGMSQYPLFGFLQFFIYSYFRADHINFYGIKCHLYANDFQIATSRLDFPVNSRLTHPNTSSPDTATRIYDYTREIT